MISRDSIVGRGGSARERAHRKKKTSNRGDAMIWRCPPQACTTKRLFRLGRGKNGVENRQKSKPDNLRRGNFGNKISAPELLKAALCLCAGPEKYSSAWLGFPPWLTIKDWRAASREILRACCLPGVASGDRLGRVARFRRSFKIL